MVKVLLSYNMVSGQEEACQRYVMRTLTPGLAELGLQISDAWYTLWGENSPQIIGGGLLDTEDDAARVLQSSAWDELIQGLDPFVNDLKIRIVRANEHSPL